MESIVHELAQMELLRDVPQEILLQVAASATTRELAPGEVLLSPEAENRSVYLLLSGTLTVHFGFLESPPIRELAPGVSVGELSVIDGTHPSAYVVAKDACRVFPIHRELVLHLVGDNNPIGRNLLQLLGHWMRANTRRIVDDRKQIWELTDHANVDALTGLYNRRWLDNALNRLLDQSAKGFQPLCLLLLDVDHFKRYNDSQGHLGGDQALAAMGAILKTTLRPYDFAVRYGGEEFLVLLPNTPLKEGLMVAERIRQAAERQAITAANGEPLPGITVSVGLAVNDRHETAEALIAAADTQLYRAKQAGRNRVCG